MRRNFSLRLTILPLDTFGIGRRLRDGRLRAHLDLVLDVRFPLLPEHGVKSDGGLGVLNGAVFAFLKTMPT